ncbi:hypothetical protein R0131_17990 [Clostridium sp. AL.422]|uniref:hypothetical protein n=1 Tax=Clostridium TaxID=1485 RepID=UPI00293DBF21|nr:MULTISPECIES: hypothetical protein [unclassified Clostridium]MDV4152723.1 hypothetical protein [Clostridium sp. AL.422]
MSKVDYGKVYCINVLFTFVAMVILCDDIYEFLLFQGCILVASLIITRYINNTNI